MRFLADECCDAGLVDAYGAKVVMNIDQEESEWMFKR